MTIERDQPDAWPFGTPTHPASTDQLLRGLEALDRSFAEQVDGIACESAEDEIFLRSVELERSLLRRLHQAVRSGDPRLLRRVLRLTAHRSHFKPVGAHTFIGPVHAVFASRDVHLGRVPGPSLAWRLEVLGGCTLATISVGGAVAALVAVALGRWALAAGFGVGAFLAWAWITWSRSRVPRSAPRRWRLADGPRRGE